MRFVDRPIFPWLIGAVVFSSVAVLYFLPFGRLLLCGSGFFAGLLQ
jgi:hypothetical protein